MSYVPGDLTLTVRAGTSLSEIERVTREHDQWLPLDPYGSTDGTIGATIATASAGPLASSFGLPRDLLLGLEFVNGRGDVVRGGGKVVKNVAGFDLSRLLTGSWGTLGVITEVTLRLYALPKADRTFVVALEANEKEMCLPSPDRHVSSPTPFALQLFNASARRARSWRTSGLSHSLWRQRRQPSGAQLSALSRVAAPERSGDIRMGGAPNSGKGCKDVIRISSLPSELPRGVRRDALGTYVPGIRTCIDPRRGVLRLVVGLR